MHLPGTKLALPPAAGIKKLVSRIAESAEPKTPSGGGRTGGSPDGGGRPSPRSRTAFEATMQSPTTSDLLLGYRTPLDRLQDGDGPDARPSAAGYRPDVVVPDIASLEAASPGHRLALDVAAAETAIDNATTVHDELARTPRPTVPPAESAYIAQRGEARQATQDALAAQQRANTAARNAGEPLPYPAADALPPASTLSPVEANDAVTRSGAARTIIGTEPAVLAPELEAVARADAAIEASATAQAELLDARQSRDELLEQDAYWQTIESAERDLGTAREDATDTARTAIEAQREANEIARREGQPAPYALADAVPAEVLADDARLTLHLATLTPSAQRTLIGSELGVRTPVTDAEEALERASAAERTLAEAPPTDLVFTGAERRAAEVAAVDAVRTQQEANASAAELGEPAPYPAADEIPAALLDDPAALHAYLARRPGATQRAILGTEAALSDAIYAADVAEARAAAAGGGPSAAAAIEEIAERYVDNPARVDQLIVDLEPEIRAASDGLATEDYGRERAQRTVDSLGRVAELASDDGARAIAATIVDVNGLAGMGGLGGPRGRGRGSSELWYLDDAINHADRGRGIALGTALVDELVAVDSAAAAEDVRDDVIDNLNALTEAARDAGDARAAADETLGESLNDFAGGLNDQEIADYVSIYRRDNASIYSEEADLALRLDEVLTRNGDALDQVAVADRHHADDIVDAYRDLAAGPLPARALEWAASATSPAVRAAFAGESERILDEVFLPASEGALLQYQTELGGDADAALDRFESVFDATALEQSVIGGVDAARGPGTLAALAADGRETVELLRSLDTPEGRDAFEQALLELENDDDPSHADTAFAVAGLVFAYRNHGNVNGYVEQLIGTLKKIKTGATLLGKSLGHLSSSGRLAFLGDDAVLNAARYAGAAKRLVPVVNVVLNGAATVNSAVHFANDPGAGTLLSAIGDGVSFIGAMVGVFGFTQWVAKPLEFGGLALAQFGEYLSGAEARNELDDAEQAILVEVFENRYPELETELGEGGFTEAIRQIADASNPTAGEVAERAGLDTEQLLRLFGTVPPSNEGRANRVLEFAEATGLRGDAFVAFSQSLDETLGGYPDGLTEFLDGALLLGLTPEQTPALARNLEGPDGQGLRFFAERYRDQQSNLAHDYRDEMLPYDVALVLERSGIDPADHVVDLDELRTEFEIERERANGG